MNGEKSTAAPVLSGIPQWTVLGPLLFVIYINDIFESITSEGFLFADDTKSFRRSHHEETRLIYSRILLLLKKGQQNGDKCHVLTIGKFDNISHKHRYKVCEEEIEHVFEEKDLEVIVDSNLSFEEHISKKVKTADGIVGLIRRSYSHLDCQSFRKIYTTFVRPHLEYTVYFL